MIWQIKAKQKNGMTELTRELRSDIKNGLILGTILGGLLLGWLFVDKFEWRYWLPYWCYFGLFLFANLRKDRKETRRKFETYDLRKEEAA